MNIKVHLISLVFLYLTHGKKFKDEEKPKWARKDIRDYNDADLERLLDQWEEGEEPLEPDELPEHLRPQPQIDFSKVDMNDPENLLKISKKGKTLMMFVSTLDELNKDETETVTKLWQTSLWNNHIQVERYLIDDNRAIFMFKDGSLAWEAKNFLIDQEKCKEVTIENKSYLGNNYQKLVVHKDTPGCSNGNWKNILSFAVIILLILNISLLNFILTFISKTHYSGNY